MCAIRHISAECFISRNGGIYAIKSVKGAKYYTIWGWFSEKNTDIHGGFV